MKINRVQVEGNIPLNSGGRKKTYGAKVIKPCPKVRHNERKYPVHVC